MSIDLNEIGVQETSVKVSSTLEPLTSADAACGPLLDDGYEGWVATTQDVRLVTSRALLPSGALVAAELVKGSTSVRLAREGDHLRRTTVTEGVGERARCVVHRHALNTEYHGNKLSEHVARTAVYWQERARTSGDVEIRVWEPTAQRLVSIAGE